MATLPTYSKVIDNAFTQTWDDIKAEVIDNVLLSTPIWAALKMAGCFSTQVGGSTIEETLRYAIGPTAVDVAKGDPLPQGTVETRTAAYFKWRYTAVPIQRNMIDDQQNQGKYRILNYVSERIQEAKDALIQRFETSLWNSHDTAETSKSWQGINDIVPPVATVCTGTYGGVARPATYSASPEQKPATGNTWWGPKVLQVGTAPSEVNLLEDMKHVYNTIDDNMEPPNLLVTTQSLFECYESYALDASQIVKDESTKLADLGFTVLRFKGKPLVWTPNCTAKTVKFLNTNWIKVKYDPTMWFSMTEWKWAAADSMDRIAHIMCCGNMYTNQPRKFGSLVYA